MKANNSAFEQFQLLAELGRGGMAEIYLAATRGPDRFSKLIVLKVLQERLSFDDRFVEMFRQEAWLSARLNHPNVVQTYQVGETAGRPFLAMEYLDGQPLSREASALFKKNTAELAIGLRIVIDALSGLQYVHELCDLDGSSLGIVHRDITPENVFVTYEGQIKVVDFGIAKTLESKLDTTSGTVKGKLGYMAPEQARGEKVDRRADIFSMGVILWELLAAKRMWEGLTDVFVMTQLMKGEVPSLAEARGDLPAGLLRIVENALHPDPHLRTSSAKAMQDELDAIFDSLKPHLTTRGLGEIMRREFQDERAQARSVIRKQLELLDTFPFEIAEHNTPSPRLVRSTQLFVGDMPRLGVGSIVHDAVTTIETETRSSGGQTSTTSGAFSTTSMTDSALISQNRTIVWVALVAVGIAGLAVGTARPWQSGGAPMVDHLDSVGATPQVAKGETKDIPLAAARCQADNKPLVEITGEISGDARLTCDKDYLLRFTTTVTAGATLWIEEGTVLRGDTDTKGTLVVQPGGKIEAQGSAERPIVFTSSEEEGRRKVGDWGGVVLLGKAPLNLKNAKGQSSQGIVEGVTRGGLYGGSDPNDSSGELSYVRIEYGGTEIAPNNEINGLTLGGVGRGTVLHHIQVRYTADDCFEFFGGTVDAKYLVCQRPGDDAFDWDYGYTGRLQFLLAQMDPSLSSGSNGLEGDNDPNGSQNLPRSSPSLYNFTLCGKKRSMKNMEHFGLLLRRASEVRVRNGIFLGFDAGMDIRDAVTRANIAASLFFDNVSYNLAYPEGRRHEARGSLFQDDDSGFDETVQLENEGLRISQRDPQIGDCYSEVPDFKPKVALVTEAAIPPEDGFFDHEAQYLGAFRDEADRWDQGEWIKW